MRLTGLLLDARKAVLWWTKLQTLTVRVAFLPFLRAQTNLAFGRRSPEQQRINSSGKKLAMIMLESSRSIV